MEGDEFELSRPLAEDRVAGEVLVERRDLGQAGQEHLGPNSIQSLKVS